MTTPNPPPDRKERSSLRQIINEVTKDKLALLESQRRLLKDHYATILGKHEKAENRASLSFLKEIHGAMKTCPHGDNPAQKVIKDLSVLFNWIDPQDSDAALYFGNKELVQEKIDELMTSIRNQIEKCEYSCMYADAMSQYMGSSDEVQVQEIIPGDEDQDGGEISSAPGAAVDRMIEFTKDVISAPDPEGFANEEFEKLLSTLFNMDDPAEKQQLLNMRQMVKQQCEHFAQRNAMDEEDLKLTIGGLLIGDPLSKEKNDTLKELRQNEDALEEVCTLLNKRLKNYKSWNWPAPVVVHFKRTVDGRYRAFMDEDILTAIFLHYVGAKWSIFFKRHFLSIYKSKTWKRGTGTLGDLYFHGTNSIEGYRREYHQRSFLSVLPDAMEDLAPGSMYDDEEASRSAKARATELTPTKIKQKLLHIISNEVHLNNILRPGNPLTVVQTDMKWFGLSLVHDVVLSLMKFFGVTEDWLNFFKKFLQAPLKVGSPSAPVQVRRRGAPICHQLTNLFGESLLFVMDLYTNRESSLSVFRIHDDFWFWSHIPERMTKAWEAMLTFTKVAGLELSEEKSASVISKLGSEDDPNSITFGPEPLPQRNVKFGFIVLHSDGIFRISDELLAPHVSEMRDYLKKADKVMSWIHGHNKYIRFFLRNFAEPALTFQRQHIVQIMEKLRWILKEVHPETNGDPVEALKLKFSKLLKNKEVLDSWVHWPMESGGLNLYNPFLDLIPLHEAYKQREEQEKNSGHTDSRFGEVIARDKSDWDSQLAASKDRKKRAQNASSLPQATDEDQEDTISDEEVDVQVNPTSGLRVTKRIGFKERCERFRETRWNHWRLHYCKLLVNLEPVRSSNGSNWKDSLYSSQIERKLGHNENTFVDDNLVPTSLIRAMQSERVHKN